MWFSVFREKNRCCPAVAGGLGRLWRRRTYYVRRLCCFLPLALNLFICVDVGNNLIVMWF
ncbi:hypothetical protein Hanom_Chr05g00398911 [Helianthus anomalus]